MTNTRSWSPRALTAAVAIVAALGITACGSSSSSSTSSSSSSSSGGSSSSSSSASSPGLQAAQADVNAHTKDPTKIGPTAPIGKPIPKGKKIVFINCGPEGCARAGAAFKQAASLLGWTVTELTPSQPTPQLIQADFQQAVSLHPDAVVSSALPLVAFQRQAAQLKAMHIPLLSIYGPDPTGGDITLQIFGTDGDDALARLAADKTVVDIGGKGTIGTVILSGYTVIADYVAAYTQEVKKVCPACQVKSITIQPTSLGTTDGTDIVNFLRANSDINALLLGYEGVGGDLTTAAKAAGITLPKTYSIATTSAGLQATENGQRAATIPADYQENGWQIADALARIFTGQTSSALTQDTKYPAPVIWSKQYNNIPPAGSTGFPPTVANYQAQFLKLWGK